MTAASGGRSRWAALLRWPAPPPPPRRREWLTAGLLVLAGVALRTVDAGASFNTDEVFSTALSARPLHETLAGALADRTHPPLHLLLLHFWTHVFGTDEPAARALSIVFSAGFLALAWGLARRVAPPAFALAATALLAASPLLVYFGQQARPYSLIALLALANLLLFARAMDRPGSTLRWLAWALAGVALVHAQYIGTLLIGLLAAVALLVLGRRAAVPVTAGVLAAASIGPWLWGAFSGPLAAGRDPLDLIAWMPLPTPRDLGLAWVAPFDGNPLLGGSLLLALYALLLAWGGARLLARGALDAQRALLLLTGLGLPAVVYAVAAATHEPIFAQRQLIGPLAVLVLAVASAAAVLPRRVAWPAVGVLLGSAVLGLPANLSGQVNAPWPEFAATLDARFPGEPVAAGETWFLGPVQWYRRSGGVRQLAPEALASTPLPVACHRECDRLGGRPLLSTWRWKGGADEMRLYGPPVSAALLQD